MDEANESADLRALQARVNGLEAMLMQAIATGRQMQATIAMMVGHADANHARYLNALGTLEARQAATVASLKGEDAKEAFEAYRQRFADANANVYDPAAWGQRPAWLAKLMPTKHGGE